MIKSVEWVCKILYELALAKFTGKLEINFYQGGIGSVNKLEGLSVPK